MTATLDQLQEQEGLVEGTVSLALSITQDYFSSLGKVTGDVLRNGLLTFLPELLTNSREQVSLDTINFYESLRSEANVSGRGPDLAPLQDLNMDALESSIRWAVGPAFETDEQTQDLMKALDQVEDVVDRWTREAEIDTLLDAIELDEEPVAWYRVNEPNSCTFCLMCASRGPVYDSAETAGKYKTYHRKCRCRCLPLFKGEPLVDGYDPKALYKQWQEAA